MDKVELLARVLQADGRGLTMVFTRTKRTAQKVADELAERGFAAAAVHGDLGQGAREQALRAFRSGKVDVLVATDVAARGIDVEDVTHVVNYQCPEDEKTYIHRIGRTGRAGKTGVAVTFVDWDDMPRWKLINDALGLDIPEPAETYSTSAEPVRATWASRTNVTGRLPRGPAHPRRAGRRRRSRTSVRPADAAPVGRRPGRSRRTQRSATAVVRDSGSREWPRDGGSGSTSIRDRAPRSQRHPTSWPTPATGPDPRAAARRRAAPTRPGERPRRERNRGRRRERRRPRFGRVTAQLGHVRRMRARRPRFADPAVATGTPRRLAP